jgi:AcrR family transcriptional regulator
MVPVVDTRQRLVAAAEEVLKREGIRGLTTKAVAQAAGRSEGSIYNHFTDRVGLIMAVIDARLPPFIAVLMELVPGQRTVPTNLERVAKALIEFDAVMLPLLGGVFADPELLVRFNAAMRPDDKGPHRPHRGITAYLEGEQSLGRVPAHVDCAAVTMMLIGGCREAVMQQLFGQPPMNLKDVPRRIVRTLIPKESS